jgi:hypothetical protein
VRDLRSVISSLALMVFLWLPTTFALAQDAHFWDAQYGTRSQLLGGLVVGAPNDLSTTYYNPAWLALEDQPSLLLTTKTFEGYTLKVENGFGNGTEPTSTKVTPSPGFFGAKFSTNVNNEKVAVAFSYLQKVKFDYNASGIRVNQESAPPPDGNYWFSGEAYKLSSVSEYWAGVTFAKRIADNIYAGITPFGAMRSQSLRTQVSAKGLDSDDNFSHLYTMENSEFWHTRVLAKLGLAFDYSPLTFGFTLTTPSLGLFGDGSVHQDGSLSGIDAFDPEGTPDTFMAVNYQPDLSPNYKSPLSMAAGIAYQFGNTGLYFSAEWFNNLEKYNMMSPDSFQSQSHPDKTFTYDISSSTRSIINWGVAGNHNFSPRFALYGSFWFDKSNLNQDEDPNMAMAFWDLMHLNLGASFEFMNIEFTSGLGYSHGSGTSDKFRSFNFEENGDVEGGFPDSKVTFNRLTFLIGFNLPFGSE